MRILLLQGPNLNLLGTREPEIYGSTTLLAIHAKLVAQAEQKDCLLECFQSQYEGELIERIHAAQNQFDFIIINPAALTHTSIALRDAFLAVQIPFIEVHLTNVYSREQFRHTSYLADIAQSIIMGAGPLGYELALLAAIHYLSPHPSA